MQGGDDHRDPPITRELRRETLRKLVTGLLLRANPNEEGLMSRLRLSATKFETEMFTTAATKEEYERVMGMRPVTSITTGGNYIGPNVAGLRARWEALSQRRVFRGQQDDSVSSSASSAASATQTQLRSFSLPLPSPGHHQAGPSLISVTNQTFPPPPQPQPQPHPRLIQQQPVPSYQQASNRAAAQSSLPNQQLVETKAIVQESQNPVGPGSSREQPITVAEDNTDWHDTAYTDLQKCREECLPVSQFIRHRISRSPQPNAKFVEVMKFMNMERRELAAAQISKEVFDAQVDIIYKLKEDLVARQRRLQVSKRQNQPQRPAGPRVAQPVSADQSQRINVRPSDDAGQPANKQALEDSTERGILAAVLSFTNGWKEEADIDAMVAWNFYGIDDLIDAGCHTLHSASRPAKRRRRASENIMINIVWRT